MEIDVYDIALKNNNILNNRYEIQYIYYWGHTSILYRAIDMETGDYVALKEFCPYFYANRDLDGTTVICKGKRFQSTYDVAYRMFLQECDIVSKLRDLPEGKDGRVLRYQNHFFENNTCYLVTEFIEGMSLEEMIDLDQEFQYRTSMKELIQIVRSLHRHGIYHRDIKPGNIIFKQDGTLVLIDFGSACYAKKQDMEVSFVSRGFSAPELYTREPSNKTTDIYSIGALQYFLLTGVQLPGADARLEGEEVKRMSELTQVSDVTRRMVEKAISINQKDRWKSLWLMEKFI